MTFVNRDSSVFCTYTGMYDWESAMEYDFSMGTLCGKLVTGIGLLVAIANEAS
jgi:hypothetical protein